MIAILCAALLAAPQASAPSSDLDPGQQAGGLADWLSVEQLAARAADTDGSGDVGAGEWSAFLASLQRDERGAVQPRAFEARILLRLVDRDRDGSLEPEDLTPLFAERDANADGKLVEAELVGPDIDNPRPGDQPDRALVQELVLRAALAGGQAELSETAWRAFLEDLPLDPDGAVRPEVSLAWIELAASTPPEDRNAFTPGVYIITLEGELDRNRDGRVGDDDLAAGFALLDTDGDGALQRSELRRRPLPIGAGSGAGQPGDWQEPWGRADAAARARAPRMPWQRNLEDALALVESTGKPLLICVNMDGETASESLAWLRYRDPAFAILASGFIPLIVSPDRHNPRDHDDRGRRLADPRFGRVVAREFMDIEPVLFERYFNGRRVAPRHVGVAPDGEILFDIFLVQDLGVIDEALVEHGSFDNDPLPAAELSVEELLASPDAGHRDRLEALFCEAEEERRVQLAARALDSARAVQHPELLRLALADPAPAVRFQATQTLASHPAGGTTELFSRALYETARDPGRTAALVDALHQLAAAEAEAESATGSRRLARVFSGLALESRLIDTARWRLTLSGARAPAETPPTAEEIPELFEHLEAIEQERRLDPDNPELSRLFAATALRCARAQIVAGQNPTFVLEDARTHARRAARSPAQLPRARALEAWASWLLSDLDGARATALEALPVLWSEAGGELDAELLRIFIRVRTRDLYAALEAGDEWPAAWVADLCAACDVLLNHPLCTQADIETYLGLLGTLDARGLQATAIARGLERFPGAGQLHAWLRFQILRDRGADALEAAYDGLAVPAGREAEHLWFSGVAQLAAAERHFENLDSGASLAAYTRSLESLRHCIRLEPSFAGSTLHYVALALAGAARVHLEAEQFPAAVDCLVAALEANPASATWADGLGRKPLETAQELLRALDRAGLDEGAARVRALLDAQGLTAGPVPEDSRGS